MAKFSEGFITISGSMETSEKMLLFKHRVLYLHYGNIKMESKYMTKKIYVNG